MAYGGRGDSLELVALHSFSVVIFAMYVFSCPFGGGTEVVLLTFL